MRQMRVCESDQISTQTFADVSEAKSVCSTEDIENHSAQWITASTQPIVLQSLT